MNIIESLSPDLVICTYRVHLAVTVLGHVGMCTEWVIHEHKHRPWKMDDYAIKHLSQGIFYKIGQSLNGLTAIITSITSNGGQ